MKKLAFVDHSFHERTGSSGFFRDLLARRFEVAVFADDSWRTGRVPGAVAAALVEGGFEILVFWQAWWPSRLVAELGFAAPVLVPMYDDVRERGPAWWSVRRGGRFVSFSRTLDALLDGTADELLPVRYFPPGPAAPPDLEDGTAFFWRRRREVDWETVRRLSGGEAWRRFHLHWAPDPGEEAGGPPDPAEGTNLEVTGWFEDRADYDRAASRCLVYFAPRLHEGIGLGFLEAMARGQCVVAPEAPTHSEYLRHGENGLLYDPGSPRPLSFAAARELGAQARREALAGREEWVRQEERILDFVAAAASPPDRAAGGEFLRRHGPDDPVWSLRGSWGGRVVRRLRRICGLGK
jgi:hypothetical protein